MSTPKDKRTGEQWWAIAHAVSDAEGLTGAYRHKADEMVTGRTRILVAARRGGLASDHPSAASMTTSGGTQLCSLAKRRIAYPRCDPDQKIRGNFYNPRFDWGEDVAAGSGLLSGWQPSTQ